MRKLTIKKETLSVLSDSTLAANDIAGGTFVPLTHTTLHPVSNPPRCTGYPDTNPPRCYAPGTYNCGLISLDCYPL